MQTTIMTLETGDFIEKTLDFVPRIGESVMIGRQTLIIRDVIYRTALNDVLLKVNVKDN
jgi:hypothetical protein